MRRMIPSKFEEWIKKIFKHVVQNGDTTEVGGDLEVDGKVKVNGKEDFTDKDGNPIDFGGGSGKPIVDSEEIVVDEGEEEIELHLAQVISNKINNSLQLPVAPPVATALVGVGTNGSQTNVGVGDGLEVVNGVLQVASRISARTFTLDDLKQFNQQDMLFVNAPPITVVPYFSAVGILTNINTRGNHQHVYGFTILDVFTLRVIKYTRDDEADDFVVTAKSLIE